MPVAGGSLGFVPNPMPIEASLGFGALRLLSESAYTLGRLAGSAGRLVNPYLIGQPLLRREAILSSRIEGTFTTPEQLVLLEAGVTAPGQDARVTADTLEVLNYVRAMERGLSIAGRATSTSIRIRCHSWCVSRSRTTSSRRFTHSVTATAAWVACSSRCCFARTTGYRIRSST